MRIALCLFKYFPYGGLQRDFVKVAGEALARGHEVKVYTMSWQGPVPSGLQVEIVAAKGLSNHARAGHFAKHVAVRLPQECDVSLGFNRQSGLDFYFAADPCLAWQWRHKKAYLGQRWWPRYRHYLQLEQAVFGRESSTRVLLLDAKQQAAIEQSYGTPKDRFIVIPPGIAKPAGRLDKMAARQQVGCVTTDLCLLAVGHDQKRKGIDRTLQAMAALPGEWKARVRLWVIGHEGQAAVHKQAKALSLSSQVTWLGSRDEVYPWMQAADLLVHPAYQETAGMVLVEALANGLPVLVTDNCGYAFHVEQAEAGRLVPGGSLFQQAIYDQALRQALRDVAQGTWQANALHYAQAQELFSMPQRVVDLLENENNDSSPYGQT